MESTDVRDFKVTIFSEANAPEVRRFKVPFSKVKDLFALYRLIEALVPVLSDTKYSIDWKDDEGDFVVISHDLELLTCLDAMPSLVKLNVRCIKEDKSANGDVAVSNEKPPSLNWEVVCNSCGGEVVGFLYKCLTCDDYNSCAKCEADEKHPAHCVLRIPSPHMSYSTINKAVKSACDTLKNVCAKEQIGMNEQMPELNQGHHHEMQLCRRRRRRNGHLHQKCKSWLNTFAGYLNEFANLAGDCPSNSLTSQVPSKPLSLDPQNEKCQSTQDPTDELASSISLENLVTPEQMKHIAHIQKTLSNILLPNSGSQESKWVPVVSSETDEINVEANKDTNTAKLENETKESSEGNSASSASSSSSQSEGIKADGWTMIDNENDLQDVAGAVTDAKISHDDKTSSDKEIKNVSSANTANTEEIRPKENKSIEQNTPLHPVPHISASIEKMLSMGFSNDNDWLTVLLERYDGSINRVIDLITAENIKN